MTSCRDQAVSSDYYDYIYNQNQITTDMSELSCTIDAGFGTSICFRPKEEGFAYENYYTLPKLFGLADTNAAEAAGALRIQRPDSLGLTGAGCLVGLIDTGIQYDHEVFLDERGRSRVVGIWDQTAEEVTDWSVPYGTAYTHAEILAGTAKGQDENGHGTFLASLAAGRGIPAEGFTGIAPEANIAMVKLKPAKRYLRELFLINDDAVAFEESDILLGVRYLLDLAEKLGMPLVILLGLESSSGSHTGSLALDDYLSQAAARTGVAVVCAAGNEGDKKHHYYGNFSSRDEFLDIELNVGNLTQATSVDRAAAGETSSDNRSVTQELSSDNRFAAGETTFAGSAATQRTSSGTGFTLEFWGAPPDIYSLSVISPGGEMVPRITASITQNGSYGFLLSPTVVEVGFRLLEFMSGDQLIFLRFRDPTPGVWRIRVYNRNLLYGSFHMWLPIDSFLAGDVSFLSPDPDTTVTAPGNSIAVLTFSGYDSRTGSFYPASGRGFTAKGLISPELTAPAANILGARLIPASRAASTANILEPIRRETARSQHDTDFDKLRSSYSIETVERMQSQLAADPDKPQNAASTAPLSASNSLYSEIARFERRSGTSCAAAIGAGACALLLEWGIRQNHLPGMRTAWIRNILIRGAVRSRTFSYPSREFGYGTLNVEEAFLVLADLSPRS